MKYKRVLPRGLVIKETKNCMLRRAIMSIPFNLHDVPDAVTIQNVQTRWPLLADVGLTPRKILELANSDDESILPDGLMREIMDSLNWYNEYHS